MSKTLFWYVFRDLLRVFVLTSLCLAGILSFVVLLKPLLQVGLNGMQIVRMLGCLLPVMLSYVLPFSVLFATTVVYGRLSGDNELIACRSGGISALSIAMPAVVLGLALSSVSLLTLSFIVPHYMLKAEKSAIASLAEAVQKSVQRSHKVKLIEDKLTIFAESADIMPPPADAPDDEVIVLHGATACEFRKNERQVDVPEDFYTARKGTAIIHREPDDSIQFLARLEDCVTFPREFGEKAITGLESWEFGPIPLESPIRENTKFMDIRQLKKLYYDPTRSRMIRQLFNEITRQEQEAELGRRILESLRTRGQYRFDGENESYVLLPEPGVKLENPKPSKVVLSSSIARGEARQVRLQRIRNGEIVGTDEARQVLVRVQAEPLRDRARVEFQMLEAVVDAGTDRPSRASFARRLGMPLPEALVALKDRSPIYYLEHGDAGSEEVGKLRRKLPGVQSGILGEINFRIAFAVTCVILVAIGSALGMMLKTGNYLFAFGVSVGPALLCFTLAVTGQHICEGGGDGWRLGVPVVWSGNALVTALAAMLLGHLQRH